MLRWLAIDDQEMPTGVGWIRVEEESGDELLLVRASRLKRTSEPIEGGTLRR